MCHPQLLLGYRGTAELYLQSLEYLLSGLLQSAGLRARAQSRSWEVEGPEGLSESHPSATTIWVPATQSLPWTTAIIPSLAPLLPPSPSPPEGSRKNLSQASASSAQNPPRTPASRG